MPTEYSNNLIIISALIETACRPAHVAYISSRVNNREAIIYSWYHIIVFTIICCTNVIISCTNMIISCTNMIISCTNMIISCTNMIISCTNMIISCTNMIISCTNMIISCTNMIISCTNMIISCTNIYHTIYMLHVFCNGPCRTQFCMTWNISGKLSYLQDYSSLYSPIWSLDCILIVYSLENGHGCMETLGESFHHRSFALLAYNHFWSCLITNPWAKVAV